MFHTLSSLQDRIPDNATGIGEIGMSGTHVHKPDMDFTEMMLGLSVPMVAGLKHELNMPMENILSLSMNPAIPGQETLDDALLYLEELVTCLGDITDLPSNSEILRYHMEKFDQLYTDFTGSLFYPFMLSGAKTQVSAEQYAWMAQHTETFETHPHTISHDARARSQQMISFTQAQIKAPLNQTMYPALNMPAYKLAESAFPMLFSTQELTEYILEEYRTSTPLIHAATKYHLLRTALIGEIFTAMASNLDSADTTLAKITIAWAMGAPTEELLESTSMAMAIALNTASLYKVCLFKETYPDTIAVRARVTNSHLRTRAVFSRLPSLDVDRTRLNLPEVANLRTVPIFGPLFGEALIRHKLEELKPRLDTLFRSPTPNQQPQGPFILPELTEIPTRDSYQAQDEEVDFPSGLEDAYLRGAPFLQFPPIGFAMTETPPPGFPPMIGLVEMKHPTMPALPFFVRKTSLITLEFCFPTARPTINHILKAYNRPQNDPLVNYPAEIEVLLNLSTPVGQDLLQTTLFPTATSRTLTWRNSSKTAKWEILGTGGRMDSIYNLLPEQETEIPQEKLWHKNNVFFVVETVFTTYSSTLSSMGGFDLDRLLNPRD